MRHNLCLGVGLARHDGPQQWPSSRTLKCLIYGGRVVRAGHYAFRELWIPVSKSSSAIIPDTNVEEFWANRQLLMVSPPFRPDEPGC